MYTITVNIMSQFSNKSLERNKKNIYTWGKIREVYTPKKFLSPISLKVREIIFLVNLF